MTLTEAAASGDVAATLTALRDLLAHAIVETKSAREISSLSRQILDVLKELEGRKPPVKTAPTGLDQLAERRKSRHKSTPRVAPRRTSADSAKPDHLP